MTMYLARTLALSLVCGLATTAPRAAGTCRLAAYSFEPDCFARDARGACTFDPGVPDMGPQVAVWLEAGDGTFVDTIAVTNAVALYGIGNRPGVWDMRSGPRFPYGARAMALPVWAHRRGKTYPAVVMGDGRDTWMSHHEDVSAPESYFCRPMMTSEVVDAVTCASGAFRSAKGVLDGTLPPSFYPPRGDLINWGEVCRPKIANANGSCFYGDARQYAVLNDLDTIATATPPYVAHPADAATVEPPPASYIATWVVPGSLPDGDYALMVEVAKEFDVSPAFEHPSSFAPEEHPFFDAYGLDGNVGQPSVVYSVPFHWSAAPLAAVATADAIGFGDPTGQTGNMSPIDDRIIDAPGRGLGRLALSSGPGGVGRVHLVEVPCAALDCQVEGPPETPPPEQPSQTQGPSSVSFSFRQASDHGAPVISYDVRYVPAQDYEVDESTFLQWAPAPSPMVGAPGSLGNVRIDGLAPSSGYAVSLRAMGACGWSDPAFVRVVTGPVKYKTLSGCVVATAAYGSDLAPQVALLRQARDWAAGRSGLAQLAAQLYAVSAPPLANTIARSGTARAAVRDLLRPIVGLAVSTGVLVHTYGPAGAIRSGALDPHLPGECCNRRNR